MPYIRMPEQAECAIKPGVKASLPSLATHPVGLAGREEGPQQGNVGVNSTEHAAAGGKKKKKKQKGDFQRVEDRTFAGATGQLVQQQASELVPPAAVVRDEEPGAVSEANKGKKAKSVLLTGSHKTHTTQVAESRAQPDSVAAIGEMAHSGAGDDRQQVETETEKPIKKKRKKNQGNEGESSGAHLEDGTELLKQRLGSDVDAPAPNKTGPKLGVANDQLREGPGENHSPGGQPHRADQTRPGGQKKVKKLKTKQKATGDQTSAPNLDGGIDFHSNTLTRIQGTSKHTQDEGTPEAGVLNHHSGVLQSKSVSKKKKMGD